MHLRQGPRAGARGPVLPLGPHQAGAGGNVLGRKTRGALQFLQQPDGGSSSACKAQE